MTEMKASLFHSKILVLMFYRNVSFFLNSGSSETG